MVAIVRIVCATQCCHLRMDILVYYIVTLYSSMQVNMECGNTARAALGVTLSLMVLALAQSQGIGKYFLPWLQL